MRPATLHFASDVAPLGTSWSFGTTWTRRHLLAGLALLALAVSLVAPVLGAASVPASPAPQLVEVVVQAADGASALAAEAVRDLGGSVGKQMPSISSFVAEVPAGASEGLKHAPGVRSVQPNQSIRLFSEKMEGDALRGAGSLDHIRKVTGAHVLDKQGWDGTGIGIALVDSGVLPVDGLATPGKVRHGPDVSLDAAMNPAVATQDGYGHGTHMAGIIAGRDAATNGQRFQGLAEDAQIVSVRAASRDGSTDLLQVLAAIDWVIQHKAQANIRVLNLSFGISDPGDYRTDALSYAVEKAWKAGIVVVVAAGNDGELPGSKITSPATNPFVLAVGAIDTKGTDDLADDTSLAASPLGSPERRVDVVAPGQSVLGLRVPGSYADVHYPAAQVDGRFFKGTGTSQATAVVSGAVADLLEQRPNLTPDQVKAILKSSAVRLPAADPVGQGAGMINLKQALKAPTPLLAVQTHEPASAAGPRVGPPPAPPGPDGHQIDTGLAGGSWTGGSWTGGSWTGGSWTGGSWTGGSWTGGSWTGGSWTGGSWTGGSWTGGSWTGGSWTGGSWTGGSWTGGSWTGGSWTGGSWTGGSWTGGSWTGGSWTGGSWTGGSWTGGSWTGGSWTGGSWTGGSWTGGSWTGGSWTGGSWTGGSWTDEAWAGGSWTGGSWTGGSWTGGSWTGGSWTGGSWTGDVWTGATWT